MGCSWKSSYEDACAAHGRARGDAGRGLQRRRAARQARAARGRRASVSEVRSPGDVGRRAEPVGRVAAAAFVGLIGREMLAGRPNVGDADVQDRLRTAGQQVDVRDLARRAAAELDRVAGRAEDLEHAGDRLRRADRERVGFAGRRNEARVEERGAAVHRRRMPHTVAKPTRPSGDEHAGIGPVAAELNRAAIDVPPP